MGVKIKIRKKDNKYRFWNTTVDAWSTGWLSKKQAIDYLCERVKRRANDEMEEIEESFPDGYWDMDSKMITDEEGGKNRQEMFQRRIKRNETPLLNKDVE